MRGRGWWLVLRSITIGLNLKEKLSECLTLKARHYPTPTSPDSRLREIMNCLRVVSFLSLALGVVGFTQQ